MSAAGSACASEPPMVPLLRTAGSPMTAAVSETTGTLALIGLDDSTSQCVVMAPTVKTPFSSLIPARPLILPRSIRCLGWARRSFIIGMRLWPPASSLASSSLSSSLSASLTRVGACYSKAAGYMVACLLLALRALHDRPHSSRRERHRLDMVDAQRRQRVHDR